MNKASPLNSVIVYFILAAAFLYAFSTQRPSEDAYDNNVPEQFSYQRAQQIVERLSAQPHYAGSDSHAEVREYLVTELRELGLSPQVQSTLALSSKRYTSTNVDNILARIPGGSSSSTDGKALLLMSHYDSALSSAKGASDAASGVATILEGVRAFLAQNMPHQNDIIILFTDAEELGLLGAEAFVAKHPWAKDVGLVLNFEARGSGGPSYMLLETNGTNRALVEAFSESGINYPQANSLMYSIYKMLPNDTDLTVFREQGNIKGFNFAFIDDHFDYHTVQDSAERLDRSSLNHQADYLMAGLAYFSNVDLNKLDAKADWVYFNMADFGMLSYPFSWVMPLAIACLLIFFATLFQGYRKSCLSIKGTLLGAIPAVSSLLVAGLTGVYGWKLMLAVFPQFADIPQGFTYNGHWILSLFILLSLVFVGLIYGLAIKKWPETRASEYFITPILIWLCINLGVADGLTGAGFFIIPVIAALVSIGLLIRNGEKSDNVILHGLLFVPGLMIIAPQIPTLTIGLGLSSVAISMLLCVLLTLLFVPILAMLWGRLQVKFLLIAGIVISLYGVIDNAGYDINNRKPSSINYLYDAASKQGYSFSYNQHLDPFVQPFFAAEPKSANDIAPFYPVNRWRMPKHVAIASPLSLTESTVNAQRQEEGDIVSLFLTIQPSASTNLIELMIDNPMTIENMSIQGESFASQNRKVRKGLLFRHIVTRDTPLNIELNYRAEEPIEFRVIDTRFDLPGQWPEFVPRPDWIMPTPFRRTDSTIISRPIELEKP